MSDELALFADEPDPPEPAAPKKPKVRCPDCRRPDAGAADARCTVRGDETCRSWTAWRRHEDWRLKTMLAEAMRDA